MDYYLRNVVTLRLDPAACIGCRLCTTVCPRSVLVVEERKAKIVDRDACMECGACARNCPVDCFTVQSGVGCATGMIFEAFGVEGDCCCSRPAGEIEKTSKPGKGCCS